MWFWSVMPSRPIQKRSTAYVVHNWHSAFRHRNHLPRISINCITLFLKDAYAHKRIHWWRHYYLQYQPHANGASTGIFEASFSCTWKLVGDLWLCKEPSVTGPVGVPCPIRDNLFLKGTYFFPRNNTIFGNSVFLRPWSWLVAQQGLTGQ